MRVWEMRRGEGLWLAVAGREKPWAAHKEISSVSQKWIKTVKNIVAIILTTLHKNQNYLGNYLGNHFRKLGISITRLFLGRKMDQKLGKSREKKLGNTR